MKGERMSYFKFFFDFRKTRPLRLYNHPLFLHISFFLGFPKILYSSFFILLFSLYLCRRIIK